MLKKVSDHWWILRFDGDEGRFVWFGYTEGEVKGKFARWMQRASSSRSIRPTAITGARSETAYCYGGMK